MSSKDNVMMTGRGGAGNVKPSAEKKVPTTTDLATPHIKSDKYTTGRGGSGNMATNHAAAPDVARASQDVDEPKTTPQDRGHTGRGGEGNTWGSGGEKKPRTGSGTFAAKDKVKEKLKDGDDGRLGAGDKKNGKKERTGSMGEQVAERGMDMLRRLRSQDRKKEEVDS